MVSVFAFLLASALLSQDLPSGEAETRHPFEDGSRVVWLGDSITHLCFYTRYLEDYAKSRYPRRKLTFVNCGVSADTTRDVLLRFEEDVIPWKPTWIFVCLGMNDGGFKAWDRKLYEDFRRHMGLLLDRIEGIGARAIVIGPPPIEPRSFLRKSLQSPQIPGSYNLVLARYGEWLSREARRRKLGFVDVFEPISGLQERLRVENPGASLIPDGIHPGPAGSCLISLAVLEMLGEKKGRFAIRLARNLAPRISGGRIEGIQWLEDGVTFRFRADSLPWVLPIEARSAASLAPAYSALNLSRIEVPGLREGTYSLFVDGTRLFSRTAGQWARGVDLGLCTGHPDWLQSERLTRTNGVRNDHIRKGIREMWLARKTRARLAREGRAGTAEFLEAEDRARRLETDLSEIGRKILEADALLDRIAGPLPHAYALRRD